MDEKLCLSKSDESCISNPKSEVADWTPTAVQPVQCDISDFGFEMQDSSDFETHNFSPTSIPSAISASPFDSEERRQMTPQEVERTLEFILEHVTDQPCQFSSCFWMSAMN